LVDLKRKEHLGVLDGDNDELSPEMVEQEALENHQLMI
jgi:hypothetical protein